MQKRDYFFRRTSLFHDYDLILCPHPVSQVLQLEDTVERQQRFISRLEEERDRCARRKWQNQKYLDSRYMGEGAEQAQRIDCLLEEGRNAETILQHTKKQVFFAEKETDRNVLATFRWRRAKQS